MASDLFRVRALLLTRRAVLGKLLGVSKPASFVCKTVCGGGRGNSFNPTMLQKSNEMKHNILAHFLAPEKVHDHLAISGGCYGCCWWQKPIGLVRIQLLRRCYINWTLKGTLDLNYYFLPVPRLELGEFRTSAFEGRWMIRDLGMWNWNWDVNSGYQRGSQGAEWKWWNKTNILPGRKCLHLAD